MFVLIVELKVREGMANVFRHAIARNAEASLRNEPGCLQFDVYEVADRSEYFILHEVYSDEAAFEYHKQTAHFAEWRIHAARCIAEGGQQNTYCRPLI